MINRLLGFMMLCCSCQALAADTDHRLHIHVYYQAEDDAWRVQYELPVAVDHVTFLRPSNFDRTTLYQIDLNTFSWDEQGNNLLIRSKDGRQFSSFNLSFRSDYRFIRKDYTHNIKYTDGSVLLYTNHLALSATILDDSPVGASFSGTQFHFYAPGSTIVFLGETHPNEAQWTLNGQGTYIYFGNIKPLETDEMIAIVDPALPPWAWQKTQVYFPKLFSYFARQTGHKLSFKPVVFFNYDQLDRPYANYVGGTLDGLVQLTINGKYWEVENTRQFNRLFHFLAHEAAHFWNGGMFSFEDQADSWMHEGGADAFANFAMFDFGLINDAQLLQMFEQAANSCALDKGTPPLAQSAVSGHYQNYYSCGAIMALASHAAIQRHDTQKSIFSLWQGIFERTSNERKYNKQDYFDALTELTGSELLSADLRRFSEQQEQDNAAAISAWFKDSDISLQPTSEYPDSALRHWGVQVVQQLMQMHCSGVSFDQHQDYVQTLPLEGCQPFSQSMDVKYIDGFDIYANGYNAYNSFWAKCIKGELVSLQDRSKNNVAELTCSATVPAISPYLRLNQTH